MHEWMHREAAAATAGQTGRRRMKRRRLQGGHGGGGGENALTKEMPVACELRFRETHPDSLTVLRESGKKYHIYLLKNSYAYIGIPTFVSLVVCSHHQ